METPGLTPGQRRLMAFQRRYGTSAVVAVITAGSVVVSVLLVVLAHLAQGEGLSQMRLELTLGVLIPAIIAPAGSATTLRLVRALDTAYRELARVASIDALTGVASRRQFFVDAGALLAAAGPQENVLVAMVDIDLFKHVNDTWGHAVGDEGLQVVARGLSAGRTVRSTVGRLGGDEFAYLALVDPQYADALRERIGETLRGLTTRAGVHIDVSVGCALVPVAYGVDAALAAADQDLYRVKATRRRRRSDRRPDGEPS